MPAVTWTNLTHSALPCAPGLPVPHTHQHRHEPGYNNTGPRHTTGSYVHTRTRFFLWILSGLRRPRCSLTRTLRWDRGFEGMQRAARMLPAVLDHCSYTRWTNAARGTNIPGYGLTYYAHYSILQHTLHT